MRRRPHTERPDPEPTQESLPQDGGGFLSALCAAPAAAEPSAQPREANHVPTQGSLALPRKYAQLAHMFEVVDRVAGLRMRRGQPLLFTAVTAAAVRLCDQTISPLHVQQMQTVAGGLIQFLGTGLQSTIDTRCGRQDGEDGQLNLKKLEKKRSRIFRDKLLAFTRAAYQKFIDELPPNSRPNHTALTATAWDGRFNLESVPDISGTHDRGGKRPRPENRSVSPDESLPTKKYRPQAAAPAPQELLYAMGDAVEVDYGGAWYPAEVCAVEHAPRPRA
jgi:hypothetical protein